MQHDTHTVHASRHEIVRVHEQHEAAPMTEHPKKIRNHERHHAHEPIGSSNAFVFIPLYI